MASSTSLQMNWLPLQTRKGGPLGLKNLGNSCYLNSVLQCLTYTPPLANFCLLNHHSSSCTFVNGSSSSVCLFCLVEKRITRSLSVDSVSESPARIHSCLTLFAKHFRQGWQEDAHEFLRYVIEACNSVCVKLHKLLAASKLRTRQDSQKISKEEPCTVVKDIFGGTLQSQVKCLSCNTESNKLDDIMDLSLDAIKTSSLREAMCRYFQPEVLDGSNKYKCEKCKKLTAARKQMSVFQAPNVLVVQLKRFENIYGGKIDRYISFDERLELHGHMCRESKDQRPEYFLYAVIVHAGYSQDSGHYYSYVKDVNGKWYCCNDAHVTSVTAKSVLSEKAYILFYVRHTTKATAKGSDCSVNGIGTTTLADQSKQSPLKSQVPSSKGNGAMKKPTISSKMIAVDTQEPSTKENGWVQKPEMPSGCTGKDEGVQPVRFNITKPGAHIQVRKPVNEENGRAGRSLIDLGQAKRVSGIGAATNGNLEFSGDSKNGHAELQKQQQEQKHCGSAFSAEQVSNANGINHTELLAKSSEKLGQKIATNGHHEKVSSVVKREGTKPDSNGHSGGRGTKGVPRSSNGVLESHISESLVESSSKRLCSDEKERAKESWESFSNGGVKRKLPNGTFVDHSLNGTEHSQEIIGEVVAKHHTPAKSLPAEESDLQSLKCWLATDSRERLLQSGWCDTVRNAFREFKKARLIQDSQFGKRGDTFASLHDLLRQKVPKELKEHLVEQLHAHFVAQRLKEK